MINVKLALGSGLVAAVIGAYMYLSFIKPGITGDLMMHDKLVIAIGVFSGLILWIWMSSDFFCRKNLRYKVLWGWTLLLANILTAVIYFIFIYFPHHREKIKGVYH